MEVIINMKGLLIKDLQLILKQKKFFVVAIALAAMFAFTSKDVTFGATYIIILLAMLVLTTFSYDEFNGGMTFILSLPASRKTYVKEKYVFTLIDLVAAAVISFAICSLFTVIQGDKIDIPHLMENILATTVGMGVVLCITIPLELKYGVEKGRIAMFAAVAIIVLIGMGGYKLLTSVLNVDLSKIANDVATKLTDVGMYVAIIAVMLVLLLISYVASNAVMKKKEF